MLPAFVPRGGSQRSVTVVSDTCAGDEAKTEFGKSPPRIEVGAIAPERALLRSYPFILVLWPFIRINEECVS